MDAEGVEALSMRRLARHLGVAPMSLYRHVADKAELVGLVVAELAARVPPGDPGRPWAEVVETTMRGVRRLLRDHPGIIGYLSDEAVVTPETLRTAETILDALGRAGLDGGEAAGAFTALWTFTLGSVLVEHTLFAPSLDSSAGEAQRRQVTQAFGAAALTDFPRLAAAVPHWLAADGEAMFETGIRLLLDAIGQRAG